MYSTRNVCLENHCDLASGFAKETVLVLQSVLDPKTVLERVSAAIFGLRLGSSIDCRSEIEKLPARRRLNLTSISNQFKLQHKLLNLMCRSRTLCSFDRLACDRLLVGINGVLVHYEIAACHPSLPGVGGLDTPLQHCNVHYFCAGCNISVAISIYAQGVWAAQRFQRLRGKTSGMIS
jgi:hypothetical protein